MNFEENKTTVSFGNYLEAFSIESIDLLGIDFTLGLEIYDLASLVCVSAFLNYTFLSNKGNNKLEQLRRENYPNWIQRKISSMRFVTQNVLNEKFKQS